MRYGFPTSWSSASSHHRPLTSPVPGHLVGVEAGIDTDRQLGRSVAEDRPVVEAKHQRWGQDHKQRQPVPGKTASHYGWAVRTGSIESHPVDLLC